jgi:hypothetical protein
LKIFQKKVKKESSGSISRDISAILKFNLAPVFLSKILTSVVNKNSEYQAWVRTPVPSLQHKYLRTSTM